MRAKWLSPIAATIAVVVLLGGCSVFNDVVPIPKVSDVAGTWTHTGPNGEHASLVLESDGQLRGQSIPRQVFAMSAGFHPVTIDWSQVHDLQGSWSIPGSREAGNPTIYVNIEQTQTSPAALTSVYVAKSEGKLYLYATLGDPDNNQEFTFYRGAK